ncbi:penicillin-insensitive murein endopeptidase [Escherichia coli]|nr:penicillin-insensitive murein endopeptidase [Escherichia coli]
MALLSALTRCRYSAPEHYQVMRTDQRRYFGHPDLVMFIQRLSSQVSNLGMVTVLIGDMGMPAEWAFQRRSCQPPDRTGCRYLSATAENSLDLVAGSCARKHWT